MPNTMNRMLVLGSGASGKTTFSIKLAAKTGLPLFHLDSLFWNPGWKATDSVTWENTVEALVGKEQWIIDGSYGGTLELRIPRADTILFIDIPSWRCIWNIIKRRIKYAHIFGLTRPGMPPDCPEQLYFSFLIWVWRYPKVNKPKVLASIQKLKKSETDFLVFRSYKEMDLYLKTL